MGFVGKLQRSKLCNDEVYRVTQTKRRETMKATKEKSPEVRLKPNTYQPNKVELESDLRVQASFGQAVKSLVKSVEIKRDT